MGMSVTSVRIRTDLQEQLEKLSGKLHRSKNWIVNEALQSYLVNQMTEAERWQETLQAIESVKAGQTIDADSVHEWMNSWGQKKEKKPPIP
jgi:predicted transcriptional regulator